LARPQRLLKEVGPLKTPSKGPTYLPTYLPTYKALKIGLEPERFELRYTLGLRKKSLHLSPTPNPYPKPRPLP